MTTKTYTEITCDRCGHTELTEQLFDIPEFKTKSVGATWTAQVTKHNAEGIDWYDLCEKCCRTAVIDIRRQMGEWLKDGPAESEVPLYDIDDVVVGGGRLVDGRVSP